MIFQVTLVIIKFCYLWELHSPENWGDYKLGVRLLPFICIVYTCFFGAWVLDLFESLARCFHNLLWVKRFSNLLLIHWDQLMVQFSSVQSLSRVRLFATPWTAAHQASLSMTNSRSLPKLMSIELLMPFNHILCCPLLLLPSIFPKIRVFSNESALCIRWPKYWSFSFSISPSNEHPGLISYCISLQSKGLSRVFSNTTVQKHQFSSAQLSLWSNSHIHTWPLEKP